MEEQKLYELMNSNLGFYLATMDGDQPRVRGMMLFKADENGIDNLLTVLVMKNCEAVVWTMETNFEPKKAISICNG